MILAFFYGQSRIFFTVARDGLLPSSLARVSRRGTPVRITIFTAIVTSRLRRPDPACRNRRARQCRNARGLRRSLRGDAGAAPARAGSRAQVPRAVRAWSSGSIGILGCLYLFISLPNRTQLFFVTAQVVGLFLYAIYGSRAAERARDGSA